MSDSDPRPLWEVMLESGMNAPGTPRDAIAAEIEALADAVVPEEPPFVSDSAPDDPIWARWDQRQEIRRHLLAEAKRAKEGRE